MSGAFDLNLNGAPCARAGCGHRRDAHATHNGTHRYECTSPTCDCLEFVIGGLPDSVAPHDGVDEGAE